MPIAPDIPAAETAIVEMTNAFREQHRLASVKPSPLLAVAARAYAKVLAARNGELSHTVDGTTPATRAQSAGYAYCQIAENLAVLYDSRGFSAADYAGGVVAGWQASPGHRDNLLMREVTETGVGIARSDASNPRYVAVQLFARPQKLKYTFKIVNRLPGAISYAFAGENLTVEPRQVITHTSCAASTIAFRLDGGGIGRYEARNGQVYTLTLAPNGGVQVEIEERAATP